MGGAERTMEGWEEGEKDEEETMDRREGWRDERRENTMKTRSKVAGKKGRRDGR